jgi:hypothetical protein
MRLKFPRFLKRFPLTILLVVIVAGIGLATETHAARLRPSLLERFGFAPRHALRGEMLRLATSVFVTHGENIFYLSLAMIVLGVGLSERRIGTAKTALVFFGVHLATLLLLSILLGIAWPRVDAWWVHLLATEYDVGPSAGYYGCLGVACHKLHGNKRTGWLSVIGGVLLARLLWSAISPYGVRGDLSADVAHLIAFPLGVSFAKRL